MAKKRVAAIVKIQIPAGNATPAPPVGTALGPHGVNIMDFCKMYNAQTESQRGTIVPVEITIFADRSFTFVTKTPPTPVLLRAAAGLDKGAQTTGRVFVGSVSDDQLADIARTKMPDLNTDDLVERVQGGFLDFDVAIATPDLMGQVGKLGRVLGPRGLMPNPKTGTVTTDVGKAVTEFKGGRVEYRTDRYGNIHVPLGKVSFDRRSLLENLQA